MSKGSKGFSSIAAAGALTLTAATSTCMIITPNPKRPDPLLEQCMDREGDDPMRKKDFGGEVQTVIGNDGNTYKLPPDTDPSPSKCCSEEFNPEIKYGSALNARVHTNITALRDQVRAQLPDMREREVLNKILDFCLFHEKAVPLRKGKVCQAFCIHPHNVLKGEVIEWGRSTAISEQEVSDCDEALANCLEIENWRDLQKFQPPELEKSEPVCKYNENMPLDGTTRLWLDFLIMNLKGLVKPEQVQVAINECVDQALAKTVESFELCPNMDKEEGRRGKEAFDKYRADNTDEKNYIEYWFGHANAIGRSFTVRYIPNWHRCIAYWPSKHGK